jgi:hypothetical protein
MYQDRLREHDESKVVARREVGRLLGVNPATLRNWIERDEIDSVRLQGHCVVGEPVR